MPIYSLQNPQPWYGHRRSATSGCTVACQEFEALAEPQRWEQLHGSIMGIYQGYIVWNIMDYEHSGILSNMDEHGLFNHGILLEYLMV